MSDLTTNNINAIRYQIGYKLNYNVPYYASYDSVGAVLTDQDNFPYNRYFRGVYYENSPVVMEREAGWRPIDNLCYRELVVPKPCKPNYCWEYPCSTIYPCKSKDSRKNAKKPHPRMRNSGRISNLQQPKQYLGDYTISP